ncbi:hypothetical protein GGH19_000520 [Coemansia sp. RSA 1807]|nr:hypothetical protein IW142_000207 [Coemansia sp. RSA 564]KAJ2411000.1 hypothetical protein J3F80_000183 [Coemansia sp. RSA 2526]KAJ2531726.1 hypothetical protein IWW43_003596 [Coemansia sp. RSA 1935]KAJ2578422.1 hypothetical protein GGH19_000520 [Coemansia sp. RSA 1807]
MGVYFKAFFVLVGGLLGGSVGFYYQAKEDGRLADLRKLKIDEMRRLNQQAFDEQNLNKETTSKKEQN